jgi:hypothetical protein
MGKVQANDSIFNILSSHLIVSLQLKLRKSEYCSSCWSNGITHYDIGSEKEGRAIFSPAHLALARAKGVADRISLLLMSKFIYFLLPLDHMQDVIA